VAIVLAAMYILRMIAGVLHQEVGPAVPEAALDLRPGELAVVVPLVGILLALSAWPASISQRSFPQDRPEAAVGSQFQAEPGVAPRRSTVTIMLSKAAP
jgi:NADH:ubiquinone oxidoreductase subunit 4 (subunit M)